MQIFDRISRIIRASTSTFNGDIKTMFEEEDDELKRIIDELNNPKKKNSNKNNTNEYSYNNAHNNTNKINSEEVTALKVLGLSPNVDNDTIKAVYKKKMKEFHPDKVAFLSEEIKNKAESRAKDINEAYNKIRKIRGF